MKALSVKQPWAALIGSGQKTIETRTWATRYRGPILICASKTCDMDAFMALECDLADAGQFLTGVTICTADLVDCRPMTADDAAAACCEVYPGAFAWVLSNIKPVAPVAIQGQLGIFEAAMPQER
jgi:hypothetical protein